MESDGVKNKSRPASSGTVFVFSVVCSPENGYDFFILGETSAASPHILSTASEDHGLARG